VAVPPPINDSTPVGADTPVGNETGGVGTVPSVPTPSSVASDVLPDSGIKHNASGSSGRVKTKKADPPVIVNADVTFNDCVLDISKEKARIDTRSVFSDLQSGGASASEVQTWYNTVILSGFRNVMIATMDDAELGLFCSRISKAKTEIPEILKAISPPKEPVELEESI
jgi:hypothetical protein